MINRYRYATTVAPQRIPTRSAEELPTMDATVIPFTPRPRTETGTPDPATAGDVLPFGSSAVYTVKEVSQYLRLSLGGTYALIRSGEIPAMKLGGRWVIPRRRFTTWLDSCAHELVEPTTGPSRQATRRDLPR
ncbi:MAG: hypothetical protein QOE51_5068 [Actinoplanes sp.]|jgi:excisionase family DNA binding protein|nr:hypothetical protein [Actinoplanes sp.]